MYHKHFSNLLSRNSWCLRINLKALSPNHLGDVEAKNLNSPFTVLEVKNALKNLDSSKAPGPD